MAKGMGRPTPSSKNPVTMIELTPMAPMARFICPKARTTIMEKPMTVSMARLRDRLNMLNGERKLGAKDVITEIKMAMTTANPPTFAARIRKGTSSNLPVWGFSIAMVSDIYCTIG
jgi:hypothetical protein